MIKKSYFRLITPIIGPYGKIAQSVIDRCVEME